ncbi:hypothetical protein CRG98_005532 [Punica granatum]|uniref:Lipoxygenase domain-containing protein n=1 Tax=Punica granatum TaxID=22663 RepID=A0A2I0KZZ9_PUNGR|nr:hypothetical protein CRG98_005532 [Punica granatum]
MGWRFGPSSKHGFETNAASTTRMTGSCMRGILSSSRCTHPEKAFLKTVTSQPLTVRGSRLLRSCQSMPRMRSTSGSRDMPEWTADEVPKEAFIRFGKRLREIEERIMEMKAILGGRIGWDP